MRPGQLIRSSSARASASGLVLLLVVLSPLTLWRLGLETSLWIDETYSLLLTTYPADEILTRTAGLGSNPPGYYLALKAWLKAARLVGYEPGVLWARLLNGLLWVALAAAAWLGGRHLLGRRAGTLLAWVVAGGACASWVARDLRGYGAATVFLFGAWLALTAVASLAPEERRRGMAWGLWGTYALCAAFALWAHLLSALVLASLGLAWLGLVAARRRLGLATLAPAAAGHALAALLYSPWLLRLGGQMAAMERSDPQWMTPPTLANLGRVVAFWYPFGRLLDPGSEAHRLLLPLGLVAVLAPLLLAAALLLLWGRAGEPGSYESGRDRSQTALTGAVLGLGGSALYVVTIWLLNRLDLAHTFHGPRYPVLAVHLWVAGLVCLAVWASARSAVRLRWAALALVPWLVASAVGQVRLARAESWGALSELRAAAGPAWPAPGERLYLMPSELTPFYRGSLAAFDVRRIERLPCEETEGGSAAVLDVSSWGELDRPRDHLTGAVLETGRLGDETRKLGYPPDRPTLALYRVEGLDGALLDELCRRGLLPPLRDRMAGSVSEALPEAQLSPEHWSYVEVSPALEVYRWSKAPRAPVVFDRPVVPGGYTLHVVGYRPGRPEPVVPVRFLLDGGGEGAVLVAEERLAEGRFHLRFEVRWPRRCRAAPVLMIEHPLWRTGGPEDGSRRSLGFLLYGAWFTPAG